MRVLKCTAYPYNTESDKDFLVGNLGLHFHFNGKENDNETYGNGNVYDFGARIYNPRLGIWLSLDPLQKKYPGVSPYNYCLNNPIVFIDPDGKDIHINYTANVDGRTLTQTVKYENGKLTNLDGSEYKGNNAYITAVKQDLDLLKTDAKETSQIVGDLQKSNSIHTISNVDRDGNKNRNRNQETYIITKEGEPDEKSSHTIFNAFDNKDLESGGTRNPRVALAHELKHADDRDKSKLSEARDKVGIKVDEVNAVKVENKVREKTGDKPRTRYSGTDIPKEELK